MNTFFKYGYVIISLLISMPALSTFRVCLTQIVSHPSLDLIRQGILDELKAQSLATEISFYNPEGQLSAALQIAQRCVGQQPDVIIALATPSAQAVAKAIKGKDIPFVFGAITDPLGAGIISSLDIPHPTFTGTIDVPNPIAQLTFFQSLMPQLETLGVLFNPAEENSALQVKALTQAAASLGLRVILQPVVKLSDISTAIAPLIGQVQAFFIPNDNLLISGLEALIKYAHQVGIPVYVSDPQSMERGADAAFANDQYIVGRETGKLAARALKGERSIGVQKIEAPLKLIKKSASPF